VLDDPLLQFLASGPKLKFVNHCRLKAAVVDTPVERKALAALSSDAAKPASVKQEPYRAHLCAQNRKQVNGEAQHLLAYCPTGPQLSDVPS